MTPAQLLKTMYEHGMTNCTVQLVQTHPGTFRMEAKGTAHAHEIRVLSGRLYPPGLIGKHSRKAFQELSELIVKELEALADRELDNVAAHVEMLGN